MRKIRKTQHDGAEICELVGLFILNNLCEKHGKHNIGLYRDDGIAFFNNISGPDAERTKKDVSRRFKSHGLNITIKTNMKIANFLDVTFNLAEETYYPYRKPNDTPLYINVKSNHPPNIIKHLPDAISRRISNISCNNTEFEKAKPSYESNGYVERIIKIFKHGFFHRHPFDSIPTKVRSNLVDIPILSHITNYPQTANGKDNAT